MLANIRLPMKGREVGSHGEFLIRGVLGRRPGQENGIMGVGYKG